MSSPGNETSKLVVVRSLGTAMVRTCAAFDGISFPYGWRRYVARCLTGLWNHVCIGNISSSKQKSEIACCQLAVVKSYYCYQKGVCRHVLLRACHKKEARAVWH